MAKVNRREFLLVIDGEESTRCLLTARLRNEGYVCQATGNGVEAMELVLNQDVAGVLLDLNLPHELGFRLLKEITAGSPDTAVIIATDMKNTDVAIRFVRQGAYDYVTKPFNLEDVILTARRALAQRHLELEHRDCQQTLELRVSERTRDLTHALAKLKSASIDTIMRLSRAAEYKDEDTGSHIERMSHYAAFVAERMGLPDPYVESILYASAMHDIGKIGIPDSILLKPDRLTDAEWSVMKQHTVIGARILEGGEAEVIKLGAAIAISHHEKWNGTGYPFGLKGEDIPVSGRIAAIADVFDSLTSKRAYRRDDFSPNETFKIIEQSVGVQFDPSVFAAFKAAWPDILSEHERFRRIEASRLREMADRAQTSCTI